MFDSIKQLIKDSWRVYRKNFGKLAIAIAAIWIPLIVIQVVLIDPSMSLEGIDEILQNEELVGTPEYENASVIMMRASAIYMAATLLISFLGLVSDIIITKITDRAYNSENYLADITFSDAFSDSVSVLPRCIWIVILTALLTVFGLMMFLLPGIYIYVMSSLAVIATILVGTKGLKAIKMSFMVIKNEFFTILAVLLAFIVINSFLLSGFEYLKAVLPDREIVYSAINGVVMFLEKFVLSFQVVIMTVFFVDRFKRINNEHPQDKAPEAEQ